MGFGAALYLDQSAEDFSPLHRETIGGQMVDPLGYMKNQEGGLIPPLLL